MRVYCTRPCDNEPHINDVEETHLTHGIRPQRYCSTCGMPLILKNQYIPLQKLGSGGFGRTYSVIDLDSPGELLSQKKRRIVKQLYPLRRLQPEQVPYVENLFKREAEVLENLRHPQIPQLYAFFQLSVPAYLPSSGAEQKLFYLVQQYIEGDDLSRELQKRRDAKENFFTEAEVVQVLTEMLDILKFIHNHQNKIIHRDIKPQNIIRHEQSKKLYLIDFGAVKEVIQQLENPGDKTDNVFVSIGFSPLEQVAGRKVSFAGDLYSLAATCINLLTGENPQTLGIPDDLNSWQNRVKVKPTLVRILNKMLSPDAKNRYQSADEVIVALKRAKLIESNSFPNWLLALGGAGIVSAIAFGLYIYNIISRPIITFQPLADSDFSRGEESLTQQASSNPQCQAAYQAKDEGMTAFKGKNYEVARDKFQRAEKLFKDTRIPNRKTDCPGDPETIIFLNNAKANLVPKKPLTLFFAITGGEPESNKIALEMLRGLAQAQHNINSNNGINGQLVEIILGKDHGKEDITKRMAQHIINNDIPGEANLNGKIISAIGHYTSNITLESGSVLGDPQYQNDRVPLISPSSTAIRKSHKPQAKYAIDLSEYVFRVVPNDSFPAKQLADYMLDVRQLQKVLVIFSDNDKFSVSLKEEFISKIKDKGVKEEFIIKCNLKEKLASECLNLPEARESQVLMLATPAEDAAKLVINANANSNRLPIIGGDTVYSQVVIDDTQENSVGMIVYSPLSLKPAQDKSTENFRLFKEKSLEFWGTTDVSWRTISTYDAMETLVTALTQLSGEGKPLTRLNMYETLKKDDFVAQGATAEVRFDKGDRIPAAGVSVLFQVKRNPQKNLKFEPIE